MVRAEGCLAHRRMILTSAVIRTLDKPLYDMSDCMIHETRERQKKKVMKMKDPGGFELTVGQWSTDHHVLTLSLLRKGPAHRRHVQMLNRYYRLMYPKKITEQVC